MAFASTVRVAALFSGGKDSTYAAYAAVQRGWELTHLLSILPADRESMLFHVPNLHMTALLAVGMHRPSRTSSAWSEPAACIRAARAGNSRPSCSTGLSSISVSRSVEQDRNGREPRACGGSSTRTSSRNRDRSPPPGLRDRPEVLEELGLLIGLRDLGSRDLRQFQAGRAEPRFPRDRERPRERFVCVGEGEVTDLSRLTDLEGPLGMVEGRLRSTEHGVHAGDLPLSDRELLWPSDDA